MQWGFLHSITIKKYNFGPQIWQVLFHSFITYTLPHGSWLNPSLAITCSLRL